ncbi:hypothetical protein F5887DRAFT_905168, partial [Amanita rubescens]
PGLAGQPRGTHDSTRREDHLYAPFSSKLEWLFARWAKLRGPSQTALDEFLAIPEFRERLRLTFKTSRKLNKMIDGQLPGRPEFQYEEVSVAGQLYPFFRRDILQCIHALYGDPDFARDMIYAPERHFEDPEGTQRVYHEMNTGKWWWKTQDILEARKRGATLIPLILSTDRTQLTLFGSKMAYPVYMTIGNIPKHIRRKPSRRAQILIAYLPDSKLKLIVNKASRRRTLANLFHSCLQRILSPIETTGVDGMEVTGGDGIRRRGHPIFALFVGDYPEQTLVAGCKYGECPKCQVLKGELGSAMVPLLARDLNATLDVLATAETDPSHYAATCRDARIKPIYHPFWENLPYSNIYTSIVPDILHQLHQGILKHLILWLVKAYSAAELDARCQRLPPSRTVRLFKQGITTLSRITGKEHDEMCRILLGTIADARLVSGLNSVRLLTAVRALLDFITISQYPIHSANSLQQLTDALDTFHENKTIFIDLNIREHFYIPKLHFCRHYADAIVSYGTTDNYNTQHTERLHCDFAKQAYKASNDRDELFQMTAWLERHEKILQQDRSITLQHELDSQSSTGHQIPKLRPSRHVTMAKEPSKYSVPLDSIVNDYGATYLRDALARFIVQTNSPYLTRAQVEQRSLYTFLPFLALPVFHRIKFRDANNVIIDAIHVQPARKDKQGRFVPARFDTALVNSSDEASLNKNIHDYRVARIRVVFSLKPKAIKQLFLPQINVPQHLAYVEWFTPFRNQPEPHHLMYRVSHALRDGCRLASIIPVSKITHSVHLFPLFGPVAPREWTTDTVLEECQSFLLNSHSSREMFLLSRS